MTEEGTRAIVVSDPQPSTSVKVSVKCRPNRLFNLISKLNDRQRAAVNRIGFGGILQLKFKTYPLVYVPQFLEAFSDGTYVFRASVLKEFMVTKYDVHDCFMLPLGPRTVDIVPTGPGKASQEEENKVLKERWREAYNVTSVSDGINLGVVYNQLEEDESGDDDFCRLFVLFCMSSFLAPTSNNVIDFKLLRVVEVVSRIPEYDWCSYVLEALVTAAVASKNKPTVLRGCIPFLMITYFQRFDFQGRSCAHDLPLIKYWDGKELKSRLDGELGKGTLGRLTFSAVKYPRCLELFPNLSEGGNASLPSSNPLQLALTSTSASESEKKYIQLELPPGVEDDAEIKDRAVDDVHELYLKMQRNAVVFYSFVADATSIIRRLTTGVSRPSEFVFTQPTQDFLEDAKLKDYVQEVHDITTRLKHSADNAPVMDQVREASKGTVSGGQGDEVRNDLCTGTVVSDLIRDAGRANEPGLAHDADESAKKAYDLSSSQIMETVEFYQTAEINEACGRGGELVSGDEPSPHSHDLPGLAEHDGLASVQLSESMVFYNTAELNEVCLRGRGSGVPEHPGGQHGNEADQQSPDEFYSSADIKDAFQKAGSVEGGTVEQVCASERGPIAIPIQVYEEEPVQMTEELGVPVDGPTQVASPHFQLTFYTTGELKEALRGVEEDGPSEQVNDDVGEKEVVDTVTNAVIDQVGPVYVPTTNLIHHPFLLHSIKPLPCMEVVPENLGCSYDCGAPVPEQTDLYRAMKCNKKIFSTVFSLRRDVMEYVFTKSDEIDQEERLVTFNSFNYLSREDMLSLKPGLQIFNSVIDCWCLLLNHIAFQHNPKVSRCFFGLNHTAIVHLMWRAEKSGNPVDQSEDMFTAWDTWSEYCATPYPIDSDLVFIPVLSGDKDHYSCACINFLTEQIEYLDNRKYDDEIEKLPYGRMARISVDEMGKYMVWKGLSKGSKVSSFKLVNIPFSWQRVGFSYNDCGVYLMIHMLLYCGEPFECDLRQKEYMNLYRAEIAASLVLSDNNVVRSDVLSRIASYKEAQGHATPLPAAPRKRIAEPVTWPTPNKRVRSGRSDKRTPEVQQTHVRSPSTTSLSSVRSHPRGRGDGLGCTLDCGVGGENTLVVSKFLLNNQKLVRDVKTLRKHVADYTFLDDYSFAPDEKLVWYNRHAVLRRGDIMSMLPDSLMSADVIECWSMLLNKLESEENEFPKMAFLGIRHMTYIMSLMETFDEGTQCNRIYDDLYQLWDTFIKDCGETVSLNANLIFIPIHIDGHFACVCLNYISQTVDILDHQFHLYVGQSEIFKAARIVAASMSDYLESRGVSRGSQIARFTHRQIKFQGQSPSLNNEESGIFTMMHMLIYEGGDLEHQDLEKKVSRRYLVVQLVAAIVLADLNILREGILRNLQTFIDGKANIKRKLLTKRKINKVLEKN